MRINLNVPFARKDEAKAQGARWDAKRKVWFVFDDDLSSDQWAELLRFIPAKALAKAAKREAKTTVQKARIDSKPGTAFSESNGALPRCDCKTPPWEDCEHTAPAIDADQAEHLRSILARS